MKHAVLILFWLAIIGLSACTQETKRMESYAVQGIDISHHQKHINWDTITTEHIDFVFIKATEGSEHQDTLFQEFWEGAKRAQIARGAYHYFSPYSSPLDQATFFIETVQLDSGDLPPVLDVEIIGDLQNSTVRKNTLIWLKAVEVYYGIKPILYTNQKFYLAHFTGEEFEGYPVWIARYNSPKNPPFIPFGRHWTFWQYGDCGHLEGIKGCVDFDVFRGERAQFEKLLYQSALPDTMSASSKTL